MSENPYIPPTEQSGTGPGNLPTHDPVAALKIPGIILIILSAISILNILAGPFLNVAMDRIRFGSSEFIFSMVTAVFIALLQAGILNAGISMTKGKDHRTCMVGAILAIIPVCSPCLVLGMPFGIWALVLLSKDEIKHAMK